MEGFSGASVSMTSLLRITEHPIFNSSEISVTRHIKRRSTEKTSLRHVLENRRRHRNILLPGNKPSDVSRISPVGHSSSAGFFIFLAEVTSAQSRLTYASKTFGSKRSSDWSNLDLVHNGQQSYVVTKVLGLFPAASNLFFVRTSRLDMFSVSLNWVERK